MWYRSVLWLVAYDNKKMCKDISMGRLIIDGNNVYEIDEECMKEKERQQREAKSGKKTIKQTEDMEQSRRKKGRWVIYNKVRNILCMKKAMQEVLASLFNRRLAA